MGTLRDVLDAIGDLKKNASEVGRDVSKLKRSSSSISSRASEGILQFPVIVSSSIDVETAQMTSKALERNYATFAQVVFSMSPTLKYHDGVNATEYLRQFHQNNPNIFDIELNLEENAIRFLNESVNYMKIKDDSYEILSATYEGSTSTIRAQNKEQAIDLMEHVRHDILNRKYTPKSEVIYKFKDSAISEKHNKIVTEASKDEDEYKFDKKNIELFKNVLTDNDVKKSNELVATTLHLRIKLINDNGEYVGTMDFIVGIKAYMHLVKSSEMIKNMTSACVNNDKIFNFLRWTTGEISFFKDFLFNVKEIKSDISDMSKGASSWWTTLKHRKALSTIGNSVLSKKGIIPNATIVISAEEVEYIRTEYGYDLKDIQFINKIMREYFLLGFVIVDSSAQLVHFYFDKDRDVQTVSFSALEKTNVNSERTFREMLKTMNRI